VRQLLFEGKYKEAEKLAQSGIMGSIPWDNASSYQTLGDINFDFEPLKGISGYRRELDIKEVEPGHRYHIYTDFIREIRSLSSIILSYLMQPEKLLNTVLHMEQVLRGKKV
jgi:hypothetical protein